MKTLLLKAGRVLSRKLTGATLALLCTAGITILAVTVTSPISVAYAQGTSTAANSPKKTPTPKRTPTPKPKFCTVCFHNKDKSIRCDEVDEFLRTHPGAKRGRCHVTGVQNR
jgi:hypothetical protein